MPRVAVIGDGLRTAGYGLAGAMICPVTESASAMQAWRDLPEDIAVVVLTAAAAGWLGGDLAARPGVLRVVLPE